MKKTILIVLFVPIILFIIFLFVGKYFTGKYVGDAFNTISSGVDVTQGSGKVFNYSEIDSLPIAPQRFFKYSIDNCAVKPAFVRMKQTGEIKTDQSQPFRKTEAVEYFAVNKNSFVWDADIDIVSFIKMRAVDSFIEGKGNILIKLMSGITITDAKGPELDSSALFRFFSEAVCFPTALLPSDNVVWKIIDDSSAELTVYYEGIKISAIFYFGQNGEVIKITTRDKYRTTKGGYQKDNFTMYCRDYKKFGSFNVPTYFETEWNLPESNFVYAKINITEIQYDVVEMY